MIGQTLAHYRVLEKIGQGGMGEVYLAEDTNLNRQVAIKVLPEQLATDTESLARFEREAQLLASLNHPNIATIHGLEESDGKRFIAMELVEGETLAERLKRGALPVEEALKTAKQIAEGLEAAHEKGVIHRDLKPANIKITPDGKVKILDFGLAKAFEAEVTPADATHSPTLTDAMTRAGVILGTAAYMSPEQAKGQEIDRRADIFAFGGVLYEMLTAQRAFPGETITETLAKILEGEPNWSELPPSVPVKIRDLIRRCLNKDSARRQQHLGDARIEIEEALSEPTTESQTVVSDAPQPGWMRVLPWGLAAVLAVIAGAALWTLTSPEPPQPVKRFVITTASGEMLGTFPANHLAISRDGRQVVYRTGRGLYLRSVDELTARQIPETNNSIGEVFSPGGDSLAFFTSGGQLKRVSLLGGTPITLSEITPAIGGWSGSWVGDTIVFSDGRGLHQIRAAGGEAQTLIQNNADNKGEYYASPELLPGGKSVLVNRSTSQEDVRIVAFSLATGERKVILEGARQPRYTSTGHLVYEVVGTGNLMAVGFDPEKLEVTGAAVPIVQGVRQRNPGDVDFALSEEGTLVYVPAATSRRSLVWVDRNGGEIPVSQEERDYATGPRISPDGKQLALGIRGEDGARHLWIYSFEADSFRNLTFQGYQNGPLAWTPDGKWIVFRSTRGENIGSLFRRLADGSRPAEQLTKAEGNQVPYSVSPNGTVLAFHETRPGTGRDILVLPMEPDSEPQVLISSPGMDCCAQFSPDGRWLAYVSDETGRAHTYVSPYPEADVKYLVSGEEGGGAPVWSPDGRELFYLGGFGMEKMMRISVQTDPTFSASTPQELFEGDYVHSSVLSNASGYYDISPDGERFLMVKEGEVGAQINVVLNWHQELLQRVPVK